MYPLHKDVSDKLIRCNAEVRVRCGRFGDDSDLYHEDVAVFCK